MAFFLSLVCAALAPGLLFFQDALSESFPVLTTLSSLDSDFAAFEKQVEAAYKAITRKRPFVPRVYTYVCGPKDTVFSIAARCSLPYEGIVTLNGIRSADEILEGRTLYLAAAPGVFVSPVAATPLDTLVQNASPGAWETAEDSAPDAPPRVSPPYVPVTVAGRTFAWNGQERFSNEARFFFLDPGFALPLEEFRLASGYGNREDPFAPTGRWQFHRGVDLAAPEGTPVKASKGGVVSEIGYNEVYGNYLIIRHAASMQSLYAHLSRVSVAEKAPVVQGSVIGEVGNTGQSTGPHLHFEIRSGETARDPASLVKGIF